jgi:RNA polymerase sigma-70 factor (ECF subfamily)
MSPDTQEITMDRKITAHLFHTVNDVVEHPERWQFDAFGQEEGQMMAEMTARSSDVVIGRKLWQEWSAFWPGKQDPFADWVNPVRKHVISTTLAENPGWNSTLVATDPVASVRRLRSEDGGDIAVVGGIETVRSLFLAGLIDELTLTTHPVVAGEGRRLFDENVPTARLKLLRAAHTEGGNAILTYALRDADE